jgi:hypothetical protein
MKYKCRILTLMIVLVLGICFTVKAEAQLSDMEMSNISGKACCATYSYGSCTGSGGPCGSSCMSCSNYTISGSQASACKASTSPNELNCKPNPTPVICKISVLCDYVVWGDEHCDGAISGCQPEDDSNCSECTFKSATNITLNDYYCGS